MRAGINAQLLYLSNSYRAAGISRYVHQLLAHLRPMASASDRLVAFTGRWPLPPELEPTAYFRVSQTTLPTWKPPVRIAWEQSLQPLAVARERLDILHSTSYVQPLLCPAKSVVTMLDLSFLRLPHSFNRGNRIYLSTMARLSAHRCDRILTISESTRQDVIHFFGVPGDKVEVTYLGVDPVFKPAEPGLLARFRSERRLPERFLLYVGTLEPRKNVERLVEAYARTRADYQIPHKLVLGGAKGWLYDRIFARVRELGLETEVLFTSYIPYDELPLWYNCADIFIYPSLYEGFGLPPLEAMACGTAVITSSVSSLPEVVGDAAITVNPFDVDALARAIASVLEDATLRQRLRTEGPKRAGRFSWNEMAAATMKAYRGLLDG
ncbi:MAG: glycosyltransferase family 4 protein [Sphingomonadaceae bacterium]